MNYLAHIYLSDKNEKHMLGNLLGDFVNITDDIKFEKGIREGIFMHRKLDSFTDSHPIFLMSKSRVSSQNRRFAGLLIDMFYDHFLAKNWLTYSELTLEAYSTNFYKILEKYSSILPDKLIKVSHFMINENWLLSYREVTGIEKALERISKRLSVPDNTLADSINELYNSYADLEDDFNTFFPTAIDCAHQILQDFK